MALLVAAGMPFGPSYAAPAYQPSPAVNGGAPTPPAVRDDLAVLTDTTASPDSRASAARRLIASQDAAVRESLFTILTRPPASEPPANPGNGAAPVGTNGDAAQILIRELGAAGSVHDSFLAPLETCLRGATPDKHPPLYRAISSIRTRAAATLLLSYAVSSATVENRDALYQALLRMTGRTDLGQDHAAWERWLTSVKDLSEEQWRSQLAANLGSRADSLRGQRDDILRRLVESERIRFVEATDPKVRSAILASLIQSDLSALRRLGIELVNRELANARQLEPEVGLACLDLLKDPTPEVRSSGADLVDRLVPSGAASALRAALEKERDPNVLAKLLRLARRFPDVASPELLMGWLGADTAVRRAAIDAIAALQAAGLLASPVDLDRALSTLRGEKPSELSLDGLKLLCELGSPEDRQAVAAMLADPSADARARAAQALTPFPDHLPAIIAAAKTDPTLFSIAAAAVAQHQTSLAGFRELSSLSAPTPVAMRDAVTAFCQRLSMDDLIAAARETTPPEWREAMLSRVVDLTVPSAPTAANPNGATNSTSPTAVAPGPTRPSPFEGPQGPLLADALLLLAGAQLDLNRPAAALSTLDLLAPASDEIIEQSLPQRLKALLYLDRFDEAIALETTPDDWLDGLAYSVSLPHALAIAAEVAYRFGSDLTDTQRARLLKLRTDAKRPASGEEAVQKSTSSQ